MTQNTTHFGFKEVATEDKVKLVRGVFEFGNGLRWI
jgi:demethylmenaquinone methyltransferase/2-methoxy-6-polyprenyl-1,4-benzoquinol methylase